MSATIPTPAQQLEAVIRSVRTERVALVAFLTAGFPSKATFAADLAAIAAGKVASGKHVDARYLQLGRRDRTAIAARPVGQPIGQRPAHLP